MASVRGLSPSCQMLLSGQWSGVILTYNRPWMIFSPSSGCVLLYAMMHNSASLSEGDHRLRDIFNRKGRLVTRDMFYEVRADQRYSQLTRTLCTSQLLENYHDATRNIRSRWLADCEALEAEEQRDVHAWVLCYHAAALSGLFTILGLVADFRRTQP
jgi:hypothetical protein